MQRTPHAPANRGKGGNRQSRDTHRLFAVHVMVLRQSSVNVQGSDTQDDERPHQRSSATAARKCMLDVPDTQHSMHSIEASAP
jgi:hypothetical protein